MSIRGRANVNGTMKRLVCGLLLLATSVMASEPETGDGNPSKQPLFTPGEALVVDASQEWSQIGATRDARNPVRGVINAFGKGPVDLLLVPDRLFPFDHLDAHGVPVYGAPVPVKADGVAGMVLSADGRTLAIGHKGNRLVLSVFDSESRQFTEVATSGPLAVKGGLSGSMTGRITRSGQVDVWFGVHNGEHYHHPDVHHHRFEYVPYDGAGFWRGGLPRLALHHVRFASTDLKEVVSLNRASEGPPEFLFDLRGMTLVPDAQAASVEATDAEPAVSLVTSEKLGIFRRFRIDPASGHPVSTGFVNGSEGVGLRHPVVNPSIAAFLDPASGTRGLIVSDSGRVWFYGLKQDEKSISCTAATPLRAPVSELALGALPVISPGDIDEDGLTDFLVGNDAGQLLWVRNIGTAQQPAFAEPVPVDVGGRPLDIKGGYRGSIQGPGEANWGYTAPTVVDWDGDGHLDVVLNSILADYMVLLRIPETNPPAFREPAPIYCDGLALHLAWRCQPAIGRREPGGRLGLIALDEQNLLRQFWRIDNQNVERGELLRFQDGSPINANVDEGAGQTGRTKMILTDWDGDGLQDLVMGTSRGLSIAASKTVFYPSSYGLTRAASVVVLRNVGTNAEPVYEYARLAEFRGERIQLGIHSCSPALIDLGRGARDLFVGEESGGIRYYPAEDLSLSSPEPK